MNPRPKRSYSTLTTTPHLPHTIYLSNAIIINMYRKTGLFDQRPRNMIFKNFLILITLPWSGSSLYLKASTYHLMYMFSTHIDRTLELPLREKYICKQSSIYCVKNDKTRDFLVEPPYFSHQNFFFLIHILNKLSWSTPLLNIEITLEGGAQNQTTNF